MMQPALKLLKPASLIRGSPPSLGECDLLSVLCVYLLEVIVHAHIFLCEEGHSYTSLSSSSCATDTVCVVLNVLGHVIVDHI